MMRTTLVMFLLLSTTICAGCDDNAPRTVTDGVDIEAIREYEANQARMDKLDAEAMNETAEE